MQTWLETGTLSSSDTLINSKSTGTRVLVLPNFRYKEFENSFAVFRNDESRLTYLTKRIISDPNYPSSMKQWELFVNSNPTCTYSNFRRDSLNNLSIETADISFKNPDNNQDGKGKVRLIRKGGLIYALQIMSNAEAWDRVSSEIGRIENSFEIRE